MNNGCRAGKAPGVDNFNEISKLTELHVIPVELRLVSSIVPQLSQAQGLGWSSSPRPRGCCWRRAFLLPAGFDPREITNLCLRNNRSVAPPSASAGGLHSAKAIR